MSEASAAADQATKEMMQLAEAAVRLSASGAKNLAAIALALSKDKKKLQGKTKLSRLLREGSELRVIPLPKEKMDLFCEEAKRYGILFSVIQENPDGTVDHLVRAQDAAKINRVFERIDYQGLPTEQEKNSTARAVSESEFSLCGQDKSLKNKKTMTSKGVSVRQRIEEIRRKQMTHNKDVKPKERGR